MNQNSRIYVAGHRGLVGSALCRAFRAHGFANLVTLTHQEADLTDPAVVKWVFSSHRPDYVVVSAAKVGGIIGNSRYPVEFTIQNMRIALNMLESAKEYGVKRLLYLGTACAYPKHADIPIKEESLLTGPLESSNEGYALAKITGVRLCDYYRREYGCDFIGAMPTNLCGLGDNYDPDNSHVVPGMIRKFHNAKTTGSPSVILWGTGEPTRDFIVSDDLAEACVTLLEAKCEHTLYNVGSGVDIPLYQIANWIAETVGFTGTIIWDTKYPDGTPRRRLNVDRLFSLGWRPKISVQDGIKIAYEDFLTRVCQQHS